MRLLTALCDALGFDVEACMVENFMPYNNPKYQYKLTKRDDTEHEDAELAAIVRARSDQLEVKISHPCPLAQFKAGHDYSASLKDKE